MRPPVPHCDPETDPSVSERPARHGDTRPAPAGTSPAPLALRFDDGREVPLTSHLTVGTAADNDLVLDDPYVSARHCVIYRSGSRVLITDFGSRNGTFLGGARIVRAELLAGLRLQVGQTAMRVRSTDGQVGDAMIGRSPALRRLRGEIARVAPTRASVLLLGESGTGKELAARAVHVESARRGQFVALNCGAIAPELIESELFGHERGAFTGATARRPGVFEEADHGTLFLDEVADLPAAAQAKLLRVLESRSVRAVGGQGERPVDVRIVAATHQDLREAVAARRFRLDLYHRLAEITLRLPSLRERSEDIPALATHFLQQQTEEGGATKVFSPEALEALVAQPWPGNIRELRNAVVRGAVLGDSVLLPSDLLPEENNPRPQVLYDELPIDGCRLDDVERLVIERALQRSHGNRRIAAEALGVAKSTLCDKVRRYGISVAPAETSY